jgi:hypothetical protein
VVYVCIYKTFWDKIIFIQNLGKADTFVNYVCPLIELHIDNLGHFFTGRFSSAVLALCGWVGRTVLWSFFSCISTTPHLPQTQSLFFITVRFWNPKAPHWQTSWSIVSVGSSSHSCWVLSLLSLTASRAFLAAVSSGVLPPCGRCGWFLAEKITMAWLVERSEDYFLFMVVLYLFLKIVFQLLDCGFVNYITYRTLGKNHYFFLVVADILASVTLFWLRWSSNLSVFCLPIICLRTQLTTKGWHIVLRIKAYC